MLVVATAVCSLAIALPGCGGSAGGIPPDAVALVGTIPVTRASVNHWTATLINGDYFAVLHRQAPAGLALDPPNYASCVRAAKQIPIKVGRKPPPLTAAQIAVKCRQLYKAAELEAVGYIISVLWSEGQAKERGFAATASEISDRIAQVKHSEYPKPGQFETYLEEKGWSQADLRFIVKRDVLNSKVVDAIKAKAGNSPAALQSVTAELKRGIEKWRKKTHCRLGYVVEFCKNLSSAPASGPSPAVLFEEME